jgi:hypothetical protein
MGTEQMIERGIMIMKEGLAWQVVYEDGHSTQYGWGAPETARIHDPRYVKDPTDVTYKGSYDEKILREGEIVHVERETIVRVL